MGLLRKKSAINLFIEFKKHRLYKYVLSLFIVILATFLQKIFWHWIEPTAYLFYYPAVILAALYGDGNSAIALSCILSKYYFVKPYDSIHISWPDGYFRLAIFIASAELVKKIIRVQTEEKLKAEAAVEMLKQRERALEFEQVARERFVSTLSHDLQTPLTTVRLNAQMILRYYGAEEKLNQAMVKQIRNINRIEGMIRNLLDANSIRAGGKIPLEFEECHLNEIIENTVQDLMHIHGDRFIIHCNQKIHGHWSANGIYRILENLCTNAVKYGDEQSKIEISAEKLREGVFLRVNNKGSPIPESEQTSIFESFTRAPSAIESKKTGWGLGLALVKGLTEAHGGLVTLESNKLHGTTFIIFLPLDSRK
jgi:signal transduction histidine kinase